MEETAGFSAQSSAREIEAVFSSLALCSRRRFSAEHFELRSSDSHRHMVVTSRDPGSLSGKAVTDGGAGSAHLGQALPTGKIGETRGSDMDAAPSSFCI